MCNLPHHFSGKLTILLLALLAIVLIVVVIAPPSYADPNFTWDRAAYWDVRYPTCFTHGRSLRDAFEFAEYKILDADQLKTWMDARVADSMPSVVVFCHDIAPDTVVESMSSRCTLRRYLDAGGKIVWYADIPMYYQGHVDGTRTGWGPNGSINILGFNAEGPPWDSEDEVVFTREGLNWGLTETWQSERPTSPSGLRVLATDGRGNAAAWVKHYVPGDNYRGFVRLFDRVGEPHFNDVRRAAEYNARKAAEAPQPSNGAMHEDTWISLSWSPSIYAVSHDVYFGENYDDVDDGRGGTFQGNQTATNFIVGSHGFAYPDGLVPGTTYYWRVDEVNDTEPNSPWKGPVWSFTTLSETPIPDAQIDQNNLPPWGGGWTHVNPTRDDRATMWQTFTPSRPTLIAVDIDILTANPGHGDDTLTIEIAGDGEILGSTDSYVPDGFDGLLRCEFPDALPVIPGQLYELRVRDTGKTTFGWRYGGNTYDRGTRYVLSKERTNTDWFFQTYPAPSLSDSRIIYVDADVTGANDGSSWADAYQCLQDALAAGQYGDVIRVAQGSYKPDQRVMIIRGGLQIISSSGDRTETFQLISGVAIKGGYAGFGEPDPDARDIEAYETILSGDLNGDDMPVSNPSDLLNEPTRAENSYHVVTGSGTNATAMLDGFNITAGNANGPTAADKRGGGMYNQGGSPTLIRCIFHSNNSKPSLGFPGSSDGGGAIYNAGGRPVLTKCTFTENNSARDGGGMFNINSIPTVTHCTFSGNSADVSGGSIYNQMSDPVVANCIFAGNSAQRGGGMRNFQNSKPMLTNCVFMGNWVETRRDLSGLVVGGAMANQNSSPTLTNCILWGDTPEEIYGGTPVITYSDVQGGWPGEGNIDADPLFVDAANGDYHLQASSPCIDAGDNSVIPAGVIVDLDGNPRIINGIVDMGAMEGGEEWPFAFNPNPADGAKYVYPDVELRWSPGDGAQLHIVYFGDNFDDVNNDAGGFLLENTTYTPGTLESDKVYYWRIDEFDGVVIHTGEVWSFTVADPLF